ncbi:hypothetical protein [Geminicoccus flavidas]|uniref:hypothetical protein n=1 Tax=Geminicoccus flavidas TaxID=2506407 RepID=UPI0013579A03|nr:hypothetical protein [Geminicoccus flavidas]
MRSRRVSGTEQPDRGSLAGIARRGLLLMPLGLATGCATPSPWVVAPPALAPLRLRVATTSFVPAPRQPGQPGDIAAANRQERARQQVERALGGLLEAAGGDAHARLVLLTANLTEEPLAGSGSLAGQLGLKASRALRLQLAAELLITDRFGAELGHAEAKATRSRAIEPGTGLAGETALADELVEGGIRLLAQTLHRATAERLGPWLA